MAELTLGDEKNLEAIDIFLFTNGDQNSPPRKYHLGTNALTMWEDTLCVLGRSHFGTEDTAIDLYNINGHKIERSSQLCHRSAYVAVKPPADFIQTGYENYLIKATRSWEKRLLKISNSMESSTKDHIEHILIKSKVNNDLNGRSTCCENYKKEVPKTMITNRIRRTIVKPNVVNLKAPLESDKANKLSALNKQVQRKKTCFTPQIKPLRQRNSPFKITSTKRLKIKTKENFQKKPLLTQEMLSVTTEGPPMEIISTNSNHKKTDNQSLIKCKLNEEKIIISNIYKNPEKEYVSITGMQCDGTSNGYIDKKILNKCISYSRMQFNKTSIATRESNCSIKPMGETNTGKDVTSKNDTNVSLLNTELPVDIQACLNCCETRKQLDHFVAILNDDKILKLQLNLEIKNCNVCSTNGQPNTRIDTHSRENVIRMEKETQVNIYESNKVLEQKMYNIEKNYTGKLVKKILNDDSKIVIINCCCCDCNGLHSTLESDLEYKETGNGNIELASANKEKTKSCDCENDPTIVQQGDVSRAYRLISTSDLDECVEKTLTITSVHKLSSCNHETVTCNDIINKDEVRQIDFIVEVKLLKKKCAIDEYSHLKANEMEGLKKYISTNTQTNWCNIMLEARHRADGRYSFHLPPLHKIKKYID